MVAYFITGFAPGEGLQVEGLMSTLARTESAELHRGSFEDVVRGELVRHLYRQAMVAMLVPVADWGQVLPFAYFDCQKARLARPHPRPHLRSSAFAQLQRSSSSSLAFRFVNAHSKFAASSELPAPVHLASRGYGHSGRVRTLLPGSVCEATI